MRVEKMSKRATKLLKWVSLLLTFALAFGAIYLSIDAIKGFIECRGTLMLTINVVGVFVCVTLAYAAIIFASGCAAYIRTINRHNEWLENQYAKGKISKQEMEENKR